MHYAKIIGQVLVDANNAEAFIIGASADSDSRHQLVCAVCVGLRPKILLVRAENVPFFQDLKFRRVDLLCIPYACPFTKRKARQNEEEPFFYRRDSAHVLKGCARATCSMFSIPHLGELPCLHYHGLDQQMPVRAFYCYRKQSDRESGERIDSANFVRDGNWDSVIEEVTGSVVREILQVHWTAQGHLVLSVMLRMMLRSTWSPLLWKEPYLRALHHLVPYHFSRARAC